jgi:antiphage defense system Thoeris ThsB-like protein
VAPRIFISFAKEDIRYRDLFTGQMKMRDAPFSFTDMSLQEPFDSKWKTQCRDKIAGCHGFIALLSKKTWRAEGARWEMACAREEGLPVLSVHIHRDDKGAVPPELGRARVIEWDQQRIAAFIERVNAKRPLLGRLFGF